MIGFPVSKNNCYTYIGDQLVYDETFARIKQREVHTDRIDELKANLADDLSLNYISIANIESNTLGTFIVMTHVELTKEGSRTLKHTAMRMRSRLSKDAQINTQTFSVMNKPSSATVPELNNPNFQKKSFTNTTSMTKIQSLSQLDESAPQQSLASPRPMTAKIGKRHSTLKASISRGTRMVSSSMKSTDFQSQKAGTRQESGSTMMLTARDRVKSEQSLTARYPDSSALKRPTDPGLQTVDILKRNEKEAQSENDKVIEEVDKPLKKLRIRRHRKKQKKVPLNPYEQINL